MAENAKRRRKRRRTGSKKAFLVLLALVLLVLGGVKLRYALAHRSLPGSNVSVPDFVTVDYLPLNEYSRPGTPLKEISGVVDGPIGRHPVDRKKMAIVHGGKQARTHWRVLEQMQGASLLECVLETGRTHQIRVHMASLGHPVLGDPVYGRKTRWNIQGGQLLHAYRLGFTHPTTGERMIFEAPAEARFYEWYHKLGGTLEALPGEADGRTKE